MRRTILIIVVVSLTFWSCETLSQNYNLGTQAAINKNWDEAVKYIERALWEDPQNAVYRISLFRAKKAASFHYLIEARKLAAQGKKEEAINEYKKAYSYDPSNKIITREVKLLMESEKKNEKPKSSTTTIVPPVKLKVPKDRIELKFVSATLRTIFQALGKSGQINILFDEQFRDMPMSISLKDMVFEEALGALCLASKNFYRVIDERSIIVAPDQPLKRAQYELTAIKTFYLSNINAQELQGQLAQMLRTQFRAPSIIVDKNLNSLTMRDTPANLELAEKLLNKWDKSKGEVIIDLEIMEVSRIKLKQLGLDFGSSDQYSVGFSYIPDSTGWVNLKDLDFTNLENFALSFPMTFLDLIESDADTKVVAQPRLRGVEGEEMKYVVSDKIPIPQTTFTPIAAGGVSQQPITSFRYEDVGISIKMKPRIHFEGEVTLEVEIKITGLGGTGYADIPILSNREVTNVIRLKDGETNLLAGMLKDEERKTLKGIGFIKNIPVLGRLFGNTDEIISQTDVILTITPHIIRSITLDEEDHNPLWIGLDGISSGAGAGPPSQIPERVPDRVSSRDRAREAARPEEERPQDQNQIFLAPADFQTRQNQEFRVSLIMRSQAEVSNFSLNIGYDSQLLEMKEIVEGSLVKQLGDSVPFLKDIQSGAATIGFSSPEIGRGVKGAGRIATLVFKAIGKGESFISLSSVSGNSPDGTAVAFITNQSRIVVR